jgi:hypothetical protein
LVDQLVLPKAALMAVWSVVMLGVQLVNQMAAKMDVLMAAMMASWKAALRVH